MDGSDLKLIREIAEELATIRLGKGSGIAGVLPAARRFLEADSLLVLSPLERPNGWEVERFEHDNFPGDEEFKQRFLTFFETAPKRYAWYDASRPEPEQRNVVIDALDIIPPEELLASRIYNEVMLPSGLHLKRQPRMLVCDGPSLLAWFGAFHDREFTALQKQKLAALLPSMQRRLRIERELTDAARTRAVLEHVLDQIGAPAFVIDARGVILEASSSGMELLDTRRRDVLASLSDAIARHRVARGTGTPDTLSFELTRISEDGTPMSYLAVLRSGSTDARIAAAVASASARWQLTPRQREVLELVVRGVATPTIAATLHVSARAIELHLTALFARADVDNRSALISAVLAGD
ncbi:MAG: helix-turn-helix transcriptional regulator [Kofleriaceae bacterium]